MILLQAPKDCPAGSLLPHSPSPPTFCENVDSFGAGKLLALLSQPCWVWMRDTLWQEVFNIRSGDNRTFLPGRQDRVVLYVSNTGCECQNHNTLGDLGTSHCWVPNSPLEMSWGAVSPLSSPWEHSVWFTNPQKHVTTVSITTRGKSKLNNSTVWKILVWKISS